MTTDAGGMVVSELRYSAFGEIRYQSGMPTTDYLYTGQRQEAEIGLYYFVARWYDPAIGRFIQADTIVPNPANAKGFDRYAYGFNNPLMYLDPSGHGPTVYMDGEQLAYTDNSHTSHISSTPTRTWTPPRHSSNSRPGNSSRPKKNKGPNSGAPSVPAPGREEALPVKIMATHRQEATIFGGDWFEIGGFTENSTSEGNGNLYYSSTENGFLVEIPIPVPGGPMVTVGLTANESTVVSANIDYPSYSADGIETGGGLYGQIKVPFKGNGPIISLSQPAVTTEFGAYQYGSVLAVEGTNDITNQNSHGVYVRTDHTMEALFGGVVVAGVPEFAAYLASGAALQQLGQLLRP